MSYNKSYLFSNKRKLKTIKEEVLWECYLHALSKQIIPYNDECKHEKTFYKYKQIRQSDETETCLIICKKCHKILKK